MYIPLISVIHVIPFMPRVPRIPSCTSYTSYTFYSSCVFILSYILLRLLMAERAIIEASFDIYGRAVPTKPVAVSSKASLAVCAEKASLAVCAVQCTGWSATPPAPDTYWYSQ